MRLCVWKSLIGTHHLAKFNSKETCFRRDITYLICHVTLQVQDQRICRRKLLILCNKTVMFGAIDIGFGAVDIVVVDI